MVYYRKYRPQTISELDLAKVRDKLTTILEKGDIPHAFLFSGPKGLGKTSSARILAKAINCKTKDGIEPCNICATCIAITNGSHIDVLEIDAASNRGIDEIRELRERVKYSPSELEKKIYIIDEVHMLTTEAFNALLKTLEEPPSHVVFILATTEPWKLLPTIISRTFEVDFEKPSREEIVRSLKRVVEGEKLVIDDEVLGSLFSLSDGAFRDAAKYLEELSLAAKGKKITEELLEETFKLATIDAGVDKLLSALEKKDAKDSLTVINNLAEVGTDFKLVIEKAVEKLRIHILKKAGMSSEGEEILGLTLSNAQKLAEYFNNAYKELRTSVLPQLPLELVTIKWCLLDKNEESRIMNNEEKQNYSSSKVTRSLQSPEKVVEIPSTKKTGVGVQPLNGGELQVPKSTSKPNGAIDESSRQARTVTNNSDFLYQLIDSIKHEHAQIAGLLRSCVIEEIGEDKIVIASKFKFHGDKLREQKSLQVLEEKATQIQKKAVKVVITVNEN